MVRFAQLTLQEPPKQVVHQYEEALTVIFRNSELNNWTQKNQPFTWVREAFAIVLDQYSSEKRKQKTYEVVVTLTPIDSPKVTACVYIPGVQPNLMSDEYLIVKCFEILIF